MPLTDQQFLMWIHERLIIVHGESHLVDYMHHLREIIADTDARQITASVARSDTDRSKLLDALWPFRPDVDGIGK